MFRGLTFLGHSVVVTTSSAFTRRKGIWPVETEWWGAGVVVCLQRGADCLHMAKTPSSRASFKSRLVLPFRYRLTQVVLEKRPLNGCSGVVSVVQYI